MTISGAPPKNRQAQLKRGRLLEYVTFGYISVEAFVGIFAGWKAGSVALISFGADSAIELTAATALLWRLHRDEISHREGAEMRSLRIVGACFFALAAFIILESTEALLRREVPEHSTVGMVLVGGAVFLMPVLARAKRQVSGAIGSRALHADAGQNDLCAYLSAITFAGLVLHRFFGWWWADPLAALTMLPLVLREGIQALRGQACACDGEAS